MLASVHEELPQFRSDVELAEDVRMLGEYLALLKTGVDPGAPLDYLADSLQLAGYFKTLPRSHTD